MGLDARESGAGEVLSGEAERDECEAERDEWHTPEGYAEHDEQEHDCGCDKESAVDSHEELQWWRVGVVSGHSIAVDDIGVCDTCGIVGAANWWGVRVRVCGTTRSSIPALSCCGCGSSTACNIAACRAHQLCFAARANGQAEPGKRGADTSHAHLFAAADADASARGVVCDFGEGSSASVCAVHASRSVIVYSHARHQVTPRAR